MFHSHTVSFRKEGKKNACIQRIHEFTRQFGYTAEATSFRSELNNQRKRDLVKSRRYLNINKFYFNKALFDQRNIGSYVDDNKVV